MVSKKNGRGKKTKQKSDNERIKNPCVTYFLLDVRARMCMAYDSRPPLEALNVVQRATVKHLFFDNPALIITTLASRGS